MKEKKDLEDKGFASNETENEDVEQNELENNTHNFIQKNSSIIIIVSVVIIAIVGFMYYSNMKEAKKIAAANLELSRIMPEFENNNFEAALNGNPTGNLTADKISGLKEIAKEYKGTNTGAISALLAGNSLVLLGNYEEAEEYFELALKTESKIVESGANAGLGACAESKNNFSEAAKYYETSASLAETPVIKERYEFFAALSYANDGKADKAASIFRKIIKEDQGTEFTDLAKSEMTRLGMIIE